MDRIRFCKSCGGDMNWGATACPGCGAAQLADSPASTPGKERRPCPYCAEEILVAAKKCKHCGEWIDRPGRATNGGADHHVPGQVVCESCGTVRLPVTQGVSSAAPVLAILCALLGAFLHWFFFLVALLLAVLWMLRTKVCRSCKSPNIVPVESPRGQDLTGDR